MGVHFSERMQVRRQGQASVLAFLTVAERGDQVNGPRRPPGSSQTVGQKKATLECLIIVDLTQAPNYSLAPAKPRSFVGFNFILSTVQSDSCVLIQTLRAVGFNYLYLALESL